jgi:hypothetical protein
LKIWDYVKPHYQCDFSDGTDEPADIEMFIRKAYAARGGFMVYCDGNSWCAVNADFQNLQESPAGFGDTPLMALAELGNQ